MSSPLGNFITITFLATADTPPAALALDGKTFYFPPEYLAAIGSGPSNPGTINAAGQKIRGYLDTTDPVNFKWVMTNELTAAQQTAIDGIPGPAGWLRPASRTTYVNQGRALVATYGVLPVDVLALLTALYNAAALNRNAQVAAGNP